MVYGPRPLRMRGVCGVRSTYTPRFLIGDIGCDDIDNDNESTSFRRPPCLGGSDPAYEAGDTGYIWSSGTHKLH